MPILTSDVVPTSLSKGGNYVKLLLSANNKLVVSSSIQPSPHRWASTGSCNAAFLKSVVDNTDSGLKVPKNRQETLGL